MTPSHRRRVSAIIGPRAVERMVLWGMTPMRGSNRRGWWGRVAGVIVAVTGAAIDLPGAAAQVAAPRPAGADESTAAITKVLDDQTAAWNRGDLDAFLNGYWNSPRVVFMSGGARHEGFAAMRDRYRKRYQADGRSMGRVTFSEVEVEPLAADAAFVRGRWGLVMPDGSKPSGLFTLIFRRFDDGWKITHDHTSVADPAPAEPAPPPATGAPDSTIIPTPNLPARPVPPPPPPARTLPPPEPPK